MDKLKISPEWTPQERLAVIDAIVEDYRSRLAPMGAWGLQQIHMLASASRVLLEKNRRNFDDYVEAS